MQRRRCRTEPCRPTRRTPPDTCGNMAHIQIALRQVGVPLSHVIHRRTRFVEISMSYKDLLLTLANYPDNTPQAAVDLAVDFAAAVGAKLSAIACEIKIAVPGSFIAPAFLNVPAMAEAEARKGREQAEAALAAFEKAALNKGVFEERILGHCLAPELSGLLVQYA